MEGVPPPRRLARPGRSCGGPRSPRVLHSDLAASRSLAGVSGRVGRGRVRHGRGWQQQGCSATQGDPGRGEGWSGASRPRPAGSGVPGRADPAQAWPGRGAGLQHTPGGEMVSDGRAVGARGWGPARGLGWSGKGLGGTRRQHEPSPSPPTCHYHPPLEVFCPGNSESPLWFGKHLSATCHIHAWSQSGPAGSDSNL